MKFKTINTIIKTNFPELILRNGSEWWVGDNGAFRCGIFSMVGNTLYGTMKLYDVGGLLCCSEDNWTSGPTIRPKEHLKSECIRLRNQYHEILKKRELRAKKQKLKEIKKSGDIYEI